MIGLDLRSYLPVLPMDDEHLVVHGRLILLRRSRCRRAQGHDR